MINAVKDATGETEVDGLINAGKDAIGETEVDTEFEAWIDADDGKGANAEAEPDGIIDADGIGAEPGDETELDVRVIEADAEPELDVVIGADVADDGIVTAAEILIFFDNLFFLLFFCFVVIGSDWKPKPSDLLLFFVARLTVKFILIFFLNYNKD